ncbi:hypothetical protein M2323_000131 [Rhodoblastus acidophilus]|uniref:hypothetical protein n=1 Tax=Rhodoblastus acidophilus TaxID=1074 RepID=UPI0022253CC3|nr:hypothetical protein [Rhodoblastus acidophilus]MCW2282362.1 hypothetical protein [Rhodoblastus acidophilus]MCW2331233.1 hypothetical protein [Rhodoblastus acidophilus]
MIFRGLCAAVVAAVLAPQAWAQSRPALCLLEVQGVHYIGGACSFAPLEKSGSFRITDAQGRVMAQVNVGKKDEGKAFWTGPQGGEVASVKLGDADRSGGCWLVTAADPDAKDSVICAWGPGEKVYVGPSPADPDPKSTLFYGARVGMYDEIAAREGLDTSHALVKTRPSHDGAVQFCREYAHDYSQKCIAEQEKDPHGNTITGDCPNKTFSDLNGGKYVFLGRTKPGSGEVFADYSIRDLASGQILDGSTASGYDVMLGFYQALCPATAPKTQR